jgi:hypothetical protein
MDIVTEARVIRPYCLEVRFEDGVVRQVDVESVLHGEVFEPLRDPAVFAQAFVDVALGTVVWPNGADLSPEYLRHDAPAVSDAEVTSR